MTSIFQRALGADFARLHPQLQQRFGVNVSDGQACVGTGVMERIWHGRAFVRPFLRLGAHRNVLVPETGHKVPFTIENYPYADSFGRETLSFVRTFDLPGGPRRFDATMIYCGKRNGVVDYLGDHQHLATDLCLRADEQGGLVIHSGEQRFYAGRLACRVPALLTGKATVHESYDDRIQRFRIAVTVSNDRFGGLFGYWGTFTAQYVAVPGGAPPARVKPRREERRS